MNPLELHLGAKLFNIVNLLALYGEMTVAGLA